MLFSICLATLIGLTWAWNQFVDTIQARTQTFFPLKEFRSPKQNINPAIFFILAFQEILLTKRHQQKIKFCLSISPLQMFGREKRAKFKQRKIQGRSVPSKRIRKRSSWDFQKKAILHLRLAKFSSGKKATKGHKKATEGRCLQWGPDGGLHKKSCVKNSIWLKPKGEKSFYPRKKEVTRGWACLTVNLASWVASWVIANVAKKHQMVGEKLQSWWPKKYFFSPRGGGKHTKVLFSSQNLRNWELRKFFIGQRGFFFSPFRKENVWKKSSNWPWRFIFGGF